MERIRMTLSDRVLGEDLRALLERHVAPLLKQLRDAVNRRAPAGTVTVSDVAVVADVTFQEPEPDAEYGILVSPESETGVPGPWAHVPSGVTRARTGFQLTVAGAPGVGASVTFRWQMTR